MTETKEYECHVALIQEEDGYSAIVLNLPGCVSQGDTREESIENVKEAIAAVIESYVDMDMPLPWTSDYSWAEYDDSEMITVQAMSD